MVVVVLLFLPFALRPAAASVAVAVVSASVVAMNSMCAYLRRGF